MFIFQDKDIILDQAWEAPQIVYYVISCALWMLWIVIACFESPEVKGDSGGQVQTEESSDQAAVRTHQNIVIPCQPAPQLQHNHVVQVVYVPVQVPVCRCFDCNNQRMNLNGAVNGQRRPTNTN